MTLVATYWIRNQKFVAAGALTWPFFALLLARSVSRRRLMQVVAEDVPWPRHASARIESWQTIHEKLVGRAKRRARHDFEEGQWLLRGMRAGVHTALAYGSYFEYVERIFGYAPKVASAPTRSRNPRIRQNHRHGGP